MTLDDRHNANNNVSPHQTKTSRPVDRVKVAEADWLYRMEDLQEHLGHHDDADLGAKQQAQQKCERNWGFWNFLINEFDEPVL